MPGICPRCNQRCHAAEERLALDGRSWHSECFTCAVCNKGLDSVSLQECRDTMEIYCRQCHRRYCSNTGYGYGPNEPTLISDQSTAKCEMKANIREQGNTQFCPPPSRLGREYIIRIPHPPFYTNQAIVQRDYDDCAPSNHNQNSMNRVPAASSCHASPQNQSQCHCPYSGGGGSKNGSAWASRKQICQPPSSYNNTGGPNGNGHRC